MVLSYFLSTLPIFTILCHNFSGREIKQKEERKNLSSKVAGEGIEPPAFGL